MRKVTTASVLGIVGCAALMGIAAELRLLFVAVLLEVGVGAFILFGLTRWDDVRCPHCDAQFFGTGPAIFARRCKGCRTSFGARPFRRR